MTHFNSLMLPVAGLAHRLTRSDGLGLPPRPVNRVMEALLHGERKLIQIGASLPSDPAVSAPVRKEPAATAQPAESR
jgi:hypothetical protein